MKNLFDLTGKRALITGSAQGIGNLLANGLAAHGAEIVINDITQQRAQAAAESSWMSLGSQVTVTVSPASKGRW